VPQSHDVELASGHVEVNDQAVVSDSKLVGLYGGQPGEVTLRILGDNLELGDNAVSGGLLQLAESLGRKLREFDLERQSLALRFEFSQGDCSPGTDLLPSFKYFLDRLDAEFLLQRASDGIPNEFGLGGKSRIFGGLLQ
jgi:hypothetical protein